MNRTAFVRWPVWCSRIRGGLSGHVFDDWPDGRFVVDGGGGGEDDFLDAAWPA